MKVTHISIVVSIYSDYVPPPNSFKANLNLVDAMIVNVPLNDQPIEGLNDDPVDIENEGTERDCENEVLIHTS